jgi:hypothetical protein
MFDSYLSIPSGIIQLNDSYFYKKFAAAQTLLPTESDEVMSDQIRVLSALVQGLKVGCAGCSRLVAFNISF